MAAADNLFDTACTEVLILLDLGAGTKTKTGVGGRICYEEAVASSEQGVL